MSGDSPAGAERNQAGPTCWSCAAAIGPRVLFCHACGKLQPPRSGEEEGGEGEDEGEHSVRLPHGRWREAATDELGHPGRDLAILAGLGRSGATTVS